MFGRKVRQVRVLGVDPGLSRCGVGVAERRGSKIVALTVGVIRTAPKAPIGARLAQLYRELTDLVARTRPDAVAVERVFMNRNLGTAMGVGQAQGLVHLCAFQAGLQAVEYTPSQMKGLLTGDGSASKEQVGYMVAAQLSLAEVPRPADAADALALALCHIQVPSYAGDTGMSPRLAAAVEAAGPGAQVASSDTSQGRTS